MILFWKKNYFWDTLYWPLTTFILLSGMNTMYLSTWGLEFTLDTFSLVSLELGNGSLTFGLKMWQLPIEWNLQGNQGKFLETNILYSQKNFLNTFSFYKMPPFSRLFVLLNQSFFVAIVLCCTGGAISSFSQIWWKNWKDETHWAENLLSSKVSLNCINSDTQDKVVAHIRKLFAYLQNQFYFTL